MVDLYFLRLESIPKILDWQGRLQSRPNKSHRQFVTVEIYHERIDSVSYSPLHNKKPLGQETGSRGCCPTLQPVNIGFWFINSDILWCYQIQLPVSERCGGAGEQRAGEKIRITHMYQLKGYVLSQRALGDSGVGVMGHWSNGANATTLSCSHSDWRDSVSVIWCLKTSRHRVSRLSWYE
jgi:hypothetical protein